MLKIMQENLGCEETITVKISIMKQIFLHNWNLNINLNFGNEYCDSGENMAKTNL